MSIKIVYNLGMGCDSVSILHRWDRDPESRVLCWESCPEGLRFQMSDLLVVTAQTGLEFGDTKRLNEAHVLPILRRNNIRYVQVARAGLSETDGVVVLSDTHRPNTCHIEGSFRLDDELLLAGTVPQYANGKRLCTLKFKGWVIDKWLSQELGDEPFIQVVGFNADELRRVEKDKSYVTVQRQVAYPLVDWGWGRDYIEEYLRQVSGEDFAKSCCTVCPFAGGKKPMLRRYQAFPEAGAEAVFLEHVALALNHRMTLYPKGKSIRQAIYDDGNEQAIFMAEQKLSQVGWALYRIRRIYWGKGNAWRKVEGILRGGSRQDMEAELARRAPVSGATWEVLAGIPRAYIHYRQEDQYPAIEEFYVAAPNVVTDKWRRTFDDRWAEQATTSTERKMRRKE